MGNNYKCFRWSDCTGKCRILTSTENLLALAIKDMIWRQKNSYNKLHEWKYEFMLKIPNFSKLGE